MKENQRQFPRTEVEVQVYLTYLEDDERTVTSRDISQGGLFMNLEDPDHYPMGELVNLRFINPLADHAENFKDAIVVRHTNNGIGVAFVEIEEF